MTSTRRTKIPLALAAALFLCAACSSREPSPRPALIEAETAGARTLYDDSGCAACHGENAEGSESGPALRDLAPYWDAERLASYLRDPEGFRAANPDFEARRETEYGLEMPAFDYLSEDEARLLARWLLTL